MDEATLIAWLREEDPQPLAQLWHRADTERQVHVGPMVHLRGLIEISSHCVRGCGYCGLRAPRTDLPRYRMSAAEIMASVQQALRLGYGTVVIQAGEDPAITQEWMSNIIRTIKRETPLAVTLSLGERRADELLAWREAGADRYLLRFETSDAELYARIHAPRGQHRCDRIALLRELRTLDYEIGSGIMVGIPGQTYAMVARDILTFAELDLDMVGIGPYLSHPQTPLGRGECPAAAPGEQVPANELMVYKAVALTRLVCPQANIPSSTALATINKKRGRENGLQRGANVVMPNLTPLQYRAMYEIYPAKACIQETGEQCNQCLRHRIASIGREVGSGPGGRRRKSERQQLLPVE